MKLKLDCFPCFIRQSIQAAAFTMDNEFIHWKTVQAVAAFLTTTAPGEDSTETAEKIHAIIKKSLGCEDPYLKVKEQYTEIAESMEPMIEELARSGNNPLETAVKIAIAGNVIDFGAGAGFDVEEAIRDALDFTFAIDHFDTFSQAVATARTVLYLGDNTGEIYFDKPLLRLLEGKEITFVTRGGPILNDATTEYCERAGIGKFAKLLDTGLLSPGFPPDRIRPEVKRLFDSADLIISKGQANLESLYDYDRKNIFCLMKVKCDLVGRLLRSKMGDIILMECGRISLNDDC